MHTLDIRARITSIFRPQTRSSSWEHQVTGTIDQKIKSIEDVRSIILGHSDPVQAFLSLDPLQIPVALHLLQVEVQTASAKSYRKICVKCLHKIVKKLHILPPTLFIDDVTRQGQYALSGGGFSDIWKGTMQGNEVCLKVLRMHTLGDSFNRQKVLTKFCEEALLWIQLEHPNIVPLFGVNTSLFSPGFCLISPWFSNGDIVSYMKMSDIAAGITYLHSQVPMIVHGDIKGANILVDNDRRCRLADFGLATMTGDSGKIFTTSSTGGPKGSFRWMAPEMYSIDGSDTLPRLKGRAQSSRDIYAYACTILEIITGKPPFPDLTDAQVMFAVLSGRRPERPTNVWCPDHVWHLVERCWDEELFRRPQASIVDSFLRRSLRKSDAKIGGLHLPESIHLDDQNEIDRNSSTNISSDTQAEAGSLTHAEESPPSYLSSLLEPRAAMSKLTRYVPLCFDMIPLTHSQP
ncbi:hypothetical protein VNI00_013403 [Paramarasmius palmivorus]|uniref:Protein kinase domain-containing protein n=1 Tax=Paramarasmius palmivorus TaxID=297713 RepID=A0AAW0C292_9AGAR